MCAVFPLPGPRSRRGSAFTRTLARSRDFGCDDGTPP